MNENPRIGKDVIESLTTGMYEDCRFIYREYIQNSADQIDKARTMGLLEDAEDEIHISIDPQERKIIIEDNATGIPADKVSSILRNIAHSTKKRGVDKGFRGIGRLGGLGYCKTLTFETSYEGEDVKSTMVWDAQKLKHIINDRTNSEEATEVISAVTTLKTTKAKKSAHYFRVELEGVTTDELLDVNRVRDYLSMVAPVDISTQFIFRNKIKDFIKKNNLHVDCYNIYINDEQIYKPYTNYIYEDAQGGKKKVDDILDVDFLMQKDKDGNIIYWGWYTLSKLHGQMKQKNVARGIRLRKENIQIGNEEICKNFFTNSSDQRFSFYYFGEIHAQSKDLIPNSRRDYFGENPFVRKFEQLVKKDFQLLREMCYDASEIKKSYKIIAQKEEVEQKIAQKESNGYASKEEETTLHKQLDELEKKSEEAKKVLEKKRKSIDEKKSPLQAILPKLAPENPKPTPAAIVVPKDDPKDKPRTKFRTDRPEYSAFNKAEKKLIGRIYASIAKAMPDEKMREAIISIIEKDLTK